MNYNPDFTKIFNMNDAIKDILWGITAFMVTSQIIIMYKGT